VKTQIRPGCWRAFSYQRPTSNNHPLCPFKKPKYRRCAYIWSSRATQTGFNNQVSDLDFHGDRGRWPRPPPPHQGPHGIGGWAQQPPCSPPTYGERPGAGASDRWRSLGLARLRAKLSRTFIVYYRLQGREIDGPPVSSRERGGCARHGPCCGDMRHARSRTAEHLPQIRSPVPCLLLNFPAWRAHVRGIKAERQPLLCCRSPGLCSWSSSCGLWLKIYLLKNPNTKQQTALGIPSSPLTTRHSPPQVRQAARSPLKAPSPQPPAPPNSGSELRVASRGGLEVHTKFCLELGA
jgi:hypothetical protein